MRKPICLAVVCLAATLTPSVAAAAPQPDAAPQAHGHPVTVLPACPDVPLPWNVRHAYLEGVPGWRDGVRVGGRRQACRDHDVREVAVHPPILAATLVMVAAAHAPAHHHPSQRAHRPSMIGLGNVPGCTTGADPVPHLRSERATMLRIVVNPTTGQDGSARPCVQAAAAAGYKVHLSIQYRDDWTPSQDADFFRKVLPQYAPFVWAVSVGNEQELSQPAGTRGQTGVGYARTWAAVEPVIAQLTPHAIRVAGEISPWGAGFLKEALAAGLPGAEALAAHPYAGLSLSAVEHLGRAEGLPVWFTEGLSLPGSWGSDLPLDRMRGAVVADAWLG